MKLEQDLNPSLIRAGSRKLNSIEQCFLDPALTALIRAGSRTPFSIFSYCRISETLAGEPMDKCKMSNERVVLA
jgi:hypothetical protein